MEAFWNMAPVMIMQCNDVTTASTKEKQEDWEHIVLTMEGSWVRGLGGWHHVGHQSTSKSWKFVHTHARTHARDAACL